MSAADLGGGDGDDPVARLALLPQVFREEAIRELTVGQRLELNARWRRWAHRGQIEPPGDWRVWLIRAGRGFGKTRAGAEWVTHFAREAKDRRVALVGATIEEVRAVMIDGPSGLAAVAGEDEPVRWNATAGELRFHSGAIASVYSAEIGEVKAVLRVVSGEEDALIAAFAESALGLGVAAGAARRVRAFRRGGGGGRAGIRRRAVPDRAGA